MYVIAPKIYFAVSKGLHWIVEVKVACLSFARPHLGWLPSSVCVTLLKLDKRQDHQTASWLICTIFY